MSHVVRRDFRDFRSWPPPIPRCLVGYFGPVLWSGLRTGTLVHLPFSCVLYFTVATTETFAACLLTVPFSTSLSGREARARRPTARPSGTVVEDEGLEPWDDGREKRACSPAVLRTEGEVLWAEDEMRIDYRHYFCGVSLLTGPFSNLHPVYFGAAMDAEGPQVLGTKDAMRRKRCSTYDRRRETWDEQTKDAVRRKGRSS
ncbi:unnamed protein product [Calypogeia fissa]